MRIFCLLVPLLLFASTVIAEDKKDDPEVPPLPDSFSEPMPHVPKALGPYTREITSTNQEARAFFKQGQQLMYAFGKYEAVRSFREAWRRDPECAFCYWGEAWAWGPYLNGPLVERDAPHAWAALQKAVELADEHASPVEQALIHALETRYAEDYASAPQRGRNEAYAKAMKKVAEQFPDDLDVRTLYADAMFVLEPRRGRRELTSPSIQRLHAVLEGVLADNIKHPGACHLYIHATESTDTPELAEACAAHLSDQIPGASHIQHMPSHTYNEVGRWADGVRANLKAWHSDQKAAYDEGVAIYPSHNLHMLLFAASMDGQGAIAVQAGKDYAKITGNSMYHLTTLLRFGRFDEILEFTEKPEAVIPGGYWDFAHGMARLRGGEPEFAKAHLQRLIYASDEPEYFRFHCAADLLGTLVHILDGEIQWEAGDLDNAIVAFEKAVVAYESMRWDEPEPLPFAAQHWLGAALLEAEEWARAEEVYRQELEHHPHNGWSLYGLQRALAEQGKSDPAVDQDLEESWARSDTWLRSSRP